MSDLARFLLDRLSDDEAKIEQVINDEVDRELVGSALFAWAPDPMPIVLNRARLLAECAANRRIIELHRDDLEHYCPTDAGSEYFNYNHGWGDADESPQICPTLKLLAEPYRSHPSFDASWLLP